MDNSQPAARGIASTYSYDGDGNRVAQTTGAGPYTYVDDVATALPVVLNEQGPDGDITYGYGLGLIEEASSTFNYFYHYDGLGSVIALTDAAGKPKAAYAYDAWGNPLLSISDSVGTKNKFRFTGEALDPGTSLYYLRARYYDPSVGRFVSRDPFAGFAPYPLNLNRYVYSLNSPVSFRDPSGLSVLDFLTSVRQFLSSPTGLTAQGSAELGVGVYGLGLVVAGGTVAVVAAPVTVTVAVAGSAISMGFGAVNLARGIKGGTESVSLSDIVSRGLLGTEKPGQVFDFVTGVFKFNPVAILDILSTWWTEGLGNDVNKADGLVQYLTFFPLPASASQTASGGK